MWSASGPAPFDGGRRVAEPAPVGQAAGQQRRPPGRLEGDDPAAGDLAGRVADPQAAAGLGLEHGALAHPAGEAGRVGELTSSPP